ncbi:MAG: LuxR family transcriptional regulator [Actinomycetota bacterium]|nr:LuxR family transcriptional regulator [Actinomycetota bacterium]
MPQILDSLQTAREAAARHAWREAYEAYSSADTRDLTPDDLESFAEAAYWTGRLDEALSLRERSYAGFASSGDKRSAARVALTLTDDHANRGAFSVAHGWFANAERLLEGLPESVEHGHLALLRGFVGYATGGNLAEAVSNLNRAYELGQRFGNRDMQAMGLALKGKVLIQMGEVDQGLALLDEAAAGAVCGELQPLAAGNVYCVTISSCHDVGDYRRAAEWTEAANRWCDRLEVTGFPGACRIHRAEILRLRGDWPTAEEQALVACEELHDFNRFVTSAGFYEVGEIRRRRGDFAAAEEAYRRANELGHEPQPGLALLRLAQGKVEAAVAGIARTLATAEDPLSRLRQLPAQVEIAIAAGDLKTARTAAHELEHLVDSYKIGNQRAPAFDATVHRASGQIKLAEGDWEGAIRCMRRAWDGWQQVGAPYETAQTRMLLGIAYRRQGDEHGAMSEFEAALATFERLGAKLDEERVKELLGRLETRRTFLFTDIVDSTRLLDTLGAEKWKRLLARHDELLRERIVDSGGEVIKQTGDGFFASFGNPKAAIEAAVGIQRALDAEVVAPDVRIGVHTGGGFHTDGDFRDYGGEGVHTAARIAAAAGPGEILASSETLDDIPTAFRLSEPRLELLKGFEQSVEVVSVAWR